MAFNFSTFNPIETVDGVAIPCPSSYQYMVSDVSHSDSGRTEDAKMHKMKIGQLVKINLTWNGLDNDSISEILQAFDPEYFTVKYWDAKRKAYRTSVFYVGDRTAPLYSALRGIWTNLSLNIIEREVSN